VRSALGATIDHLSLELSQAVQDADGSVATAESLTGGQLAAALSAVPEAGEWYRGGVVAYQPQVKYSLLDAPHGPVVTAATAVSMARSVGELLRADFSVAVTGVGGPDSDEGKAAGTVYLATWARGRDTLARREQFTGGPLAVIEQTIDASLRALLARVRRQPA